MDVSWRSSRAKMWGWRYPFRDVDVARKMRVPVQCMLT